MPSVQFVVLCAHLQSKRRTVRSSESWPTPSSPITRSVQELLLANPEDRTVDRTVVQYLVFIGIQMNPSVPVSWPIVAVIARSSPCLGTLGRLLVCQTPVSSRLLVSSRVRQCLREPGIEKTNPAVPGALHYRSAVVKKKI